MQTYTPQTGLTPQGQQINNMSNLLSTVQTMPQKAPTPQQSSTITGAAQQMQNQFPTFQRQQQQSLIKQSGIPQLQQQQTNLQNLFPLWLADQGFAQKYAGQQQNMFTANPGQQNPYTQSPDAIVAALSQPSGKGFQGFTDPNMNSQAMMEAPTQATNLIDQINSLLGGEQQLVGQQQQQGTTAYQNQLNDLLALAQGAQSAQSANVSSSGFQRGSPQEAAFYFNSILDSLGASATPQDVWNYLNTHDQSLRAQGINVDQLWQMQRNLAQKSPGTIATGKVKGASTGKVPKQNAKGQWVMPNGAVLQSPFGINLMGQHLWGQQLKDVNGNVVDPASFWAEYKAAGATDDDVIQRLVAQRYTIAQ